MATSSNVSLCATGAHLSWGLGPRGRADVYERISRGQNAGYVGLIYWLTAEQVKLVVAQEHPLHVARQRRRQWREHKRRQRLQKRYPWWGVSEFLPRQRHG
jgi:hypothetical protein